MTKNRTLWIMQGLLAALFLFAGGVKVALPSAELAKLAPMLAPSFLRFVAVCELLGAVGLILPWLLRIQPVLTPLAAGGLVIIMIGATTVTLMMNTIAVALFPLVVGLLLAYVVYGRWQRAA